MVPCQHRQVTVVRSTQWCLANTHTEPCTLIVVMLDTLQFCVHNNYNIIFIILVHVPTGVHVIDIILPFRKAVFGSRT